MKKIKNVIIIIVILMSVGNVSLAHGGNITGWKDKDSENITEYNGKYYGYHKEDGVVHYHQVKWDEENQKWVIVMPAVYYIGLEFDEVADEKDKYDRYLSWIWIDDELLQNLLVENGLAENYMLQNNYKYAGMLQESEENAKNNKLGIWSEETRDTQNNESENQIIENNNTDIQDNNLVYMILGIAIILIISIFSIAHNKKKEK